MDSREPIAPSGRELEVDPAESGFPPSPAVAFERQVNEIRSMFRVIRLTTPPPDGITQQLLLVPAGSSDVQVLEWAAQVLDPASLAELRVRIAEDARAERDRQGQ